MVAIGASGLVTAACGATATETATTPAPSAQGTPTPPSAAAPRPSKTPDSIPPAAADPGQPKVTFPAGIPVLGRLCAALQPKKAELFQEIGLSSGDYQYVNSLEHPTPDVLASCVMAIDENVRLGNITVTWITDKNPANGSRRQRQYEGADQRFTVGSHRAFLDRTSRSALIADGDRDVLVGFATDITPISPAEVPKFERFAAEVSQIVFAAGDALLPSSA